MAILSYLRTSWSDTDPSVMLRLYKALIRSRIEYGGFLLHPLSTKNLKKITVIQNRAIRLAMGYRKSTPINIMLAEAKEPPISFRFQYLCINYLARIESNSAHPLSPVLDKLITRRNNPTFIRNSKPLLLIGYGDLIPIQHCIASSDRPWCYSYAYESLWYKPDIDLEKGSILRETADPNSQFLSIFKYELNNGLCWFTDGSKMRDKEFVGFANLNTATGDGGMFRTVKYASIFTAEAMAITTTLQAIFENKESKFYIFSDSRSVLCALKNHYNSERQKPTILAIKDQLYRLSLSNKKVKLFWIPAHVGIGFNETVDQLAKDSIMRGINTQLLIPASDF